MRLRTLGECVIEVGEIRIAPDSKVVFALLLYLGLERGKRVLRAPLMEMFWPESPPDKAAHSLRQTIYQCRKVGVAIEATRTEVMLPPGLVVSDLDDLDAAPATARRPAASEFLPGYNPNVSEAFSMWLDRHRSIVQAKLRRQLLIEMANRKAAGEWEGASGIARELLQIDPLNEEGTLVLAEATAMAGNKAGALHILDGFARDVDHNHQLTLPATVLRKRIAEQFKDSDRAGVPLIGRSDVLAEVNQLLRQVKKGEGRTVLFWGPPGIGKSRLIAEVEKTAQLQGFQVAKVECHIADEVRPLSAFTEIVPQLLQLRGALGCSPHSLGLLKRLTAIELEQYPSSQEYDGAADLAGHVRRAMLDLLDAIVAESALALIVEDVHWLDKASWELFCILSKWGTAKRLILVHTSRVLWPTNAPQEGCESFARIALRALEEGDAHRLFQTATSPTASPLSDEAWKWFVSVAGGNPYFVTELARHHNDNGKPHTIPASLESLLSDRLRRLDPSSLRLLQVISLLGRQSTIERFEQVLETEAFRLLSAIEELELHDLVRVDNTQITPSHALLGDNAVKLSSPAARRLIHHRIAQVLEREVLETNSPSLLWTCEEHWRAAGERDRATKLAKRCAAHLLSLGLASDAAEILSRTLDDTVGYDERQVLLGELGSAYRAMKDWSRVSEILESCIALKQAAGVTSGQHSDDELRLLESKWFAAQSKAETQELGLEHIEQLLRCVRSPDSNPHHRLEASRLGLIACDNCDDRHSMEEFHSSVRELLRDDNCSLQQRLEIRLIYGTVCGDLKDAVAAAMDLVHHVRETGSVSELIRTLHNCCTPFRYAGRFQVAETFAREAAEIARQRRLWRSYADVLDTLGAIELDQNKIQDAQRTFLVAHAKQSEYAGTLTDFSLQSMLFRVALAQGDVDQARRWRTVGSGIPHDTMERARNEAIANNIAFAAMNSIAPIRKDVETLHTSYRKNPSSGRRDYTTCALVLGLQSIGDTITARSTFEQYLNEYRREQFDLPDYLVRLTNLAVVPFIVHSRAQGSR